jgi:hypothetical protein
VALRHLFCIIIYSLIRDRIAILAPPMDVAGLDTSVIAYINNDVAGRLMQRPLSKLSAGTAYLDPRWVSVRDRSPISELSVKRWIRGRKGVYHYQSWRSAECTLVRVLQAQMESQRVI